LSNQDSENDSAPQGEPDRNRADRIEAVCSSFVNAWLSRPRVEEYLAGVSDDPALRDLLLTELLLRELVLKSRHGESSNLDDYLRRFPETPQPVCRAFERWHLQQSIPRSSIEQPQPAGGSSQHQPLPMSTQRDIPLPSTLQGKTAHAGGGAHPVQLPARDFEIIRELGRGASGVVHLAHQISLGRNVALKVTRNVGSEARTMASLEHQHIVQVFSEHIDAQHDQRYLCMQYVCGATLSGLIRAARRTPREELSGAKLIELIESLCGVPHVPQGGLGDRDRMMACDYYQAVCWIGWRLAEALAYAHSRNVLHRDIKPANVLIDLSGRPFLADFSLALNTSDGGASDSFGGTLPYMAPEHLDALHPGNPATADRVDERSDIYSLGMALRELITLGRDHHENTSNDGSVYNLIAQLAARRRLPPEPLRREADDVPEVLDRAIVRSLAPEPDARYSTAGEFAEALQACSDRMEIERKLPPAGYAADFAARRPFLAAVLTSHLPHVLGAAFCPAYNAVVLFERLTVSDRLTFALLPIVYGLVMFPLQALAGYIWFYPATQTLVRLRKLQPVSSAEAALARRRFAQEPLVSLLQSGTAWLPLLAYVPLYMHLLISPMTVRELLHLTISIAFSILIVGTFSFLVLQYYTVRVWYPALAVDAVQLGEMAAHDLKHVPARARLCHFLAVLSPLLASMLLLGVGPAEFGAGGGYYLGYRILVVLLILLGLVGAQVSFWISTRIVETVDALTSAAARRR